MHLDIRDVMQWEIFMRGTWEEPESRVLESALNEGSVFYDIGANIGYHTLNASKAVSMAGRVISFEPLRVNRSKLSENISSNGCSNICIIDKALGDVPGEVTISVPSGQGGMASVREVSDPTLYERVSVETLDRIVDERSLPLPNVVKIDVEGAESNVLKGMKEVLNNAKDMILLVEITPPYLLELGGSEAELRSFLEAHRFCHQRLISRVKCYNDDGTYFFQTNEMFSRRRLI